MTAEYQLGFLDAKRQLEDALADEFTDAIQAKGSHISDLEAEIYRLTVALETSRAVKVKPLVWESPCTLNNWVYTAPSPFGTYYIHICGGRHQSWLESHEKPYEQACHDNYVGSVEAAQSLAGDNYADRILTLIEKEGDA